jgi:transcriptional regulator with XRE-family HTH domain
MVRKRILAAKGVTNPLQKILGVYLRIRRKSVGLSDEYMAQSLGVSTTYYRTIESGQATVGIGWVSVVISVFAPRRIYIDFSSLAALLAGIAILEKSLQHEIDLVDPFKALADYSEFKELIGGIRSYFDFQSTETEKRNFLVTTAYEAMRDYLESSQSEKNHLYPHLVLKDMSPKGIKILKMMYLDLNGRRFVGE